MAARQLTQFLDANHVAYRTITHAPAYSAQQLAASTHFHGREVAKTIVVNVDGKSAMAVVPSPAMLDVRRLREAVGATKASVASESELVNRFADCDLGAMPPFGNLYGMDVFVDEALTRDQEIVFNAGSHTEAMRLAYDDFARLVKPRVAHLTLDN